MDVGCPCSLSFSVGATRVSLGAALKWRVSGPPRAPWRVKLMGQGQDHVIRSYS